MNRFIITCLSFLLWTPALLASTKNISSKGEIHLESRFFSDDKESQTQDVGYGLSARLEVQEDFDKLTTRLQVFSRTDRVDSTRQRLNIEELYTQLTLDEWAFFVGYKVLNWSTAEAFHPTDVVNSRNFDGPFENAEKLGELMAGFQYYSDFINLSAFYMPSLSKPQLPTQSNRLSFAPLGVNVNEVTFVSNDGELKKSDDFVSQWAVHAQIPWDDLEMNFYWVHHYDRTDFRTIPNLNTGTFVPVLNEVDHYGLSLQYVWESWIFKSETVYRDFKNSIAINEFATTLERPDYGLYSLATEYLLPHDSGAETTFIIEFQSIFDVEEDQRYIINPFQRDLLVGARYAFNDINAKEFFISLIADVERGKELLASASYSQRLSDVWKFKVGARYIDAPSDNPLDFTGMRPLNNDHQFDITFSRYF